MAYQRKEIDIREVERQRDICAAIREKNEAAGRQLLAMVDTYGCQQNEADSEKIRGYLAEMGYGFTTDEFEADVIVINTCAVRDTRRCVSLAMWALSIIPRRPSPAR